MKKKQIAALTMGALVLMGSMQYASPMRVNAAQAWNVSHYGMDFDEHLEDHFDISNWANGDMFDCTWNPDNVKFNNGQMELTIDKDSSGYTGGEYRTKEYFGYGMFQVNMKPISNPGVVSSFFTYTGPSDGTKWDEIDIEFLGYDTTKVQFNYYTDGVANHEYLYNLGFDASKEFHTYGFNWYEGGITWYVDGQPVYTATKDIPNTPGKIMMNVWPGRGVDDWLQPFNGKTGLTAYYDWAAYDAPNGESTQIIAEVPVNEVKTEIADNTSVSQSASMFDNSKIYKIINYNSGLALDADHGWIDNGVNILQYDYHGAGNQKWIIEQQANGYYTIKNQATGKVVTVQDFADYDGGNVHQWEYVGNDNQEWSIVTARNNTYKIINRHSGKALNVSWASKDANANIEQYQDVNGDAELFWIDLAD